MTNYSGAISGAMERPSDDYLAVLADAGILANTSSVGDELNAINCFMTAAGFLIFWPDECGFECHGKIHHQIAIDPKMMK